MPATSLGSTSDFLNTSDIQLKTEVQISFASCSTQPGWSKNCSNSFCAVSTLTLFHQKESLSSSLFPDQLQEYIFHSCLIPPILFISIHFIESSDNSSCKSFPFIYN